MYVIVVGGGKVGYYLTKELLAARPLRSCSSRRIPVEPARSPTSVGSIVLARDGCEGKHLAEAGSQPADAIVAAVTGDDEDNLVVCQMAKHHFDVPRTIARVNNPQERGALPAPRGGRHHQPHAHDPGRRQSRTSRSTSCSTWRSSRAATWRSWRPRSPSGRRPSVDGRATSTCPMAARCSWSSGTRSPSRSARDGLPGRRQGHRTSRAPTVGSTSIASSSAAPRSGPAEIAESVPRSSATRAKNSATTLTMTLSGFYRFRHTDLVPPWHQRPSTGKTGHQRARRLRARSGRPVYVISVAAASSACIRERCGSTRRRASICPARTPSNIRLYSEDDIRRVLWIRHLTQNLGVNLAGVRILFELEKRMGTRILETLFADPTSSWRSPRPTWTPQPDRPIEPVATPAGEPDDRPRQRTPRPAPRAIERIDRADARRSWRCARRSSSGDDRAAPGRPRQVGQGPQRGRRRRRARSRW